MSKLKEILETYGVNEEVEEFDSLDDYAMDEELEDEDAEIVEAITDIYEGASEEERALIDEMLSTDEGYEELLEMISESQEELEEEEDCDSDSDEKSSKKKKKSKKVDTKSDDEDESDMDKDEE